NGGNDNGGNDNGGNDNGGNDNGGDQQENPSEPPADTPATEEPPGDGATVPPGDEQPEVRASANGDDAAGTGRNDDGAGQATPGVGTATNDGGQQAAAADATGPQAVNGGLADTGAQLWPAAVGAALLVAGVVLLRRVRRT
ncbi:hypothetical protein ACFWUX_25440, partial [Streptomyces sp. NPDC058625]